MKEHMLLWSELNHEQLKHLEYIGVDERYYYEWYFTDFQIQNLNQRNKRMLINMGIIQIGFTGL